MAHTVDFTLQLTAATRVTSCAAWVAGAGTADWATDVLTLRRGIATRLGVALEQVRAGVCGCLGRGKIGESIRTAPHRPWVPVQREGLLLAWATVVGQVQ